MKIAKIENNNIYFVDPNIGENIYTISQNNFVLAIKEVEMFICDNHNFSIDYNKILKESVDNADFNYALKTIHKLQENIIEPELIINEYKKYDRAAYNIVPFSIQISAIVRAFSKYGVIGDKNCTEGGNIYINPQSWAILGDVIPNQYMDNLFKSIDGMETEYGIPLCKPAYKKYYFPVGRMSGMLPGVYENGGIYHHACGFKIMADCKAGRRQQALNSWLW